MKQQQLIKNIIATVTYYDVADYALTSFEIWRHLIHAPHTDQDAIYSLGEVVDALRSRGARQYIVEDEGFYFLPGREHLAPLRQERESISMTKIHKLRRSARRMQYVPFVRMIAITGRLAYKGGDHGSDLDVLIVMEHGHLYTGRFLMTVLLQLLGVRKHDGNHSDHVCLNYYATTQGLELKTRDQYGAHEYTMIMPLYGHDVFEDFIIANSKWIGQYRPHVMQKNDRTMLLVRSNSMLRICKAIMQKILSISMVENILRNIQQGKIHSNPKTALETSVIIADDHHLVFLPRPHGPEVFEEYIKRYEALEVNF